MSGVERQKKAGHKVILAGMALFLLLVMIGSFLLGRYGISPLDLLKILWSRVVPVSVSWEPITENIVLYVRLPRILMAVLVRAALSVTGATD